MRPIGVSPVFWVGLFTAVLRPDEAAAFTMCQGAWGILACVLLGGRCRDILGTDYCCPKDFRRLGEEEEHSSMREGHDLALSFEEVEAHFSTRQLALDACTTTCPEGSTLCDDPHMDGLSGQNIEWSGEDGGWYVLIKDEALDLQINVRLTAPLPVEFPHRQLVTGVSVLSGGHSFVLEVSNPYSVETSGCPDGVHPCLANGALAIAVDDIEALSSPVQGAELLDGLTVSATNLPVECWQFGGGSIWAAMYEEMLLGHRVLKHESFEMWVLRFRNMAAPDWCAKYVSERGLADVQSAHAVLKVETTSVALRINVGINHQGGGEKDWDGQLLPDLDFWQMDVGFEGLLIGDSLSGILGETARPVLDNNGQPIMSGPEAIRGVVEDYRVSGALGIDFALEKKL